MLAGHMCQYEMVLVLASHTVSVDGVSVSCIVYINVVIVK